MFDERRIPRRALKNECLDVSLGANPVYWLGGSVLCAGNNDSADSSREFVAPSVCLKKGPLDLESLDSV